MEIQISHTFWLLCSHRRFWNWCNRHTTTTGGCYGDNSESTMFIHQLQTKMCKQALALNVFVCVLIAQHWFAIELYDFAFLKRAHFQISSAAALNDDDYLTVIVIKLNKFDVCVFSQTHMKFDPNAARKKKKQTSPTEGLYSIESAMNTCSGTDSRRIVCIRAISVHSICILYPYRKVDARAFTCKNQLVMPSTHIKWNNMLSTGNNFVS